MLCRRTKYNFIHTIAAAASATTTKTFRALWRTVCIHESNTDIIIHIITYISDTILLSRRKPIHNKKQTRKLLIRLHTGFNVGRCATKRISTPKIPYPYRNRINGTIRDSSPDQFLFFFFCHAVSNVIRTVFFHFMDN